MNSNVWKLSHCILTHHWTSSGRSDGDVSEDFFWTISASFDELNSFAVSSSSECSEMWEIDVFGVERVERVMTVGGSTVRGASVSDAGGFAKKEKICLKHELCYVWCHLPRFSVRYRAFRMAFTHSFWWCGGAVMGSNFSIATL